MPPRPVTPDALADLLTELCAAAAPSGRLRVAVDGPPAASPGTLADAVAAGLRTRGRPVARAGAEDFLRPASLRLEHGRTDPEAHLYDRLDVAALRRELLEPWGTGGAYLPTFWDPVADRATRAEYVPVPDTGVLLVDGSMLLGRGLPFDLAVHLRLSPGALGRRVREDWLREAFTLYATTFAPEDAADVVVRWDDPRHPAVEVRTRPATG
ncbi:MAG TPA: uridine kinase [Mycobacteriales bacterium]